MAFKALEVSMSTSTVDGMKNKSLFNIKRQDPSSHLSYLRNPKLSENYSSPFFSPALGNLSDTYIRLRQRQHASKLDAIIKESLAESEDNNLDDPVEKQDYIIRRLDGAISRAGRPSWALCHFAQKAAAVKTIRELIVEKWIELQWALDESSLLKKIEEEMVKRGRSLQELPELQRVLRSLNVALHKHSVFDDDSESDSDASDWDSKYFPNGYDSSSDSDSDEEDDDHAHLYSFPDPPIPDASTESMNSTMDIVPSRTATTGYAKGGFVENQASVIKEFGIVPADSGLPTPPPTPKFNCHYGRYKNAIETEITLSSTNPELGFETLEDTNATVSHARPDSQEKESNEPAVAMTAPDNITESISIAVDFSNAASTFASWERTARSCFQAVKRQHQATCLSELQACYDQSEEEDALENQEMKQNYPVFLTKTIISLMLRMTVMHGLRPADTHSNVDFVACDETMLGKHEVYFVGPLRCMVGDYDAGFFRRVIAEARDLLEKTEGESGLVDDFATAVESIMERIS